MRRTRKGQDGFTIVEAMIAVLVLGLILLAWMSLESFTAQTVRRVADFSAAQKVFITIMNDILTAEKGLPAQEIDADTQDLRKPNLTRAELEGVFAANKLKKQFCLDRNAIPPKDDSGCYYLVSYFKYRVRDNSFAGSDLENIPLARVVVQIRYRDRNDVENQNADDADDVWKTRYLTRLVSNVADF